MYLLGGAYSCVSKVFSATLLTNFQVCVSVQLSQVAAWDSTLSVKAVNVLTDDKLEVLLLCKFNECHMSLGWVSFLDAGSQLVLSSCLSGLGLT